MNDSSISYELLRFKSSSDEFFLDAMEVYRKSTSYDQKTNIKEITYWVDNLKQFVLGELFFFGLKANGELIGYAELAYIKQDRVLIIDYINIAPEYKANSSFFSFYTLIMAYLERKGIDYDFITIEILGEHNDTQIRNEEVCQYELENFKIVNTLYRQPLLESRNEESSTDAIIMINICANDSNRIKKETYLHIVDTIYTYYLFWDSKICTIAEFNERSLLKEKNTNAIKEDIIDDYISLSGCPINPFSKMKMNKIPPKRKNTIWYALFYCLIITGIILGILYLLKKMGYEIDSVIAIAIFVVVIFILFMALIDKNTLKVSKKLLKFLSILE